MSPSTWTIVWPVPNGKFGFTDIEDCAGSDDALEAFLQLRGDPQQQCIPTDAQIHAIRPGTGTPSWRK